MFITLVPIWDVDKLRQTPHSMALIQSPFFLAMAIYGLLNLPGTIVVSGEGIEQQYWLRKNKRIRWGNIVEIDSDPKDRRVTIQAADGTKIDHSFFHSGRQRFLQELKQHCGSELPEDFPREPLENV